MANKLYAEDDIRDIAQAIREKNSGDAMYSVAEMGDAIRAITSGGSEPLAEFSQMNPIVAQYMAEVTYSPSDYSASQVVPYLYTETDYEKGHPAGYGVNITQSGELHLADELSVVKTPSVVGANMLYNAVPNDIAHWWNTVDGNTTQNGTIKPTGQVRMIKTAASNVRDLGGWACDGGTVKYGKLFRGGLLSENDRGVLVDQCKVRHDLDLRGKGDNDGLTVSPLGDDITYTCPEEYVWYSLKNEDDWKTILGTVFHAVAKNEPVIFHCAAGADRTGTVACILEAILGVSQGDTDKDFELTSFAIFPNARRRTDANWLGLINEINAISVGATLRDKVINWVGYLGFTAEDINAFRAAMIDGTPEGITLEEYTPEEPEAPEVNYFNAETASLNQRIGSSGTLSAYDGMVVTDFIPWDDAMSGKNFVVSGVTQVLNTAYSYNSRTVYYDANKTKVAEYNDSGDLDGYIPSTFGAYTGGGFVRISLVLKDNVAITVDNVTALKITLK